MQTYFFFPVNTLIFQQFNVHDIRDTNITLSLSHLQCPSPCPGAVLRLNLLVFEMPAMVLLQNISNLGPTSLYQVLGLSPTTTYLFQLFAVLNGEIGSNPGASVTATTEMTLIGGPIRGECSFHTVILVVKYSETSKMQILLEPAKSVLIREVSSCQG